MDLDWRQGYKARYYATFVDPDSWADGEKIELLGGSIKKVNSDLLESADLNCTRYSETNERWVRVWLDATQGAKSGHIALFTGLAISPGREIEGRMENNTLQCYSVLKPAQDILLERGYYVPVGIDGGQMVKQLLSDLNSPVDISTELSETRYLSQSIVAEEGETKLSMAWKVVDAMGWRMRITGHGEIVVGPYADEPVMTFDSIENDILESTIAINYDWYDCPNVFRASIDDQVAIARDESEDSAMSIQTRGREVWAEESNCVLNDKETLQEYAQRRLKELQRVSLSISYDRRGVFDPDIYPTDLIGLHYPVQNIEGTYLITSQTIELGFGARTSEEVVRV